MAKPFDLDKTPFDVLDRRLTTANAVLGEAPQALSAARGETISRRDVETGLVAVLGLDEIVDLLDRDIDTRRYSRCCATTIPTTSFRINFELAYDR